VPEQANPQAPATWQAIRLSGSDALAARASKRLRSDELMVISLGSTVLRKHLDDVPLWRGEHVPVKQLVEDFARYLYLPRLVGPEVLLTAIRDGVALLTWQSDTFAYAESHDEAAGRYRGLRGGQVVSLIEDGTGMLVKPDVAQQQLEAERQKTQEPDSERPTDHDTSAGGGRIHDRESERSKPAQPKRFHATKTIEALRFTRDAGVIADEVVQHFNALANAKVRINIDIEVDIPEGASEQLVRTVTENCRTLKFGNFGFEKE
jgi:hypothetical protein